MRVFLFLAVTFFVALAGQAAMADSLVYPPGAAPAGQSLAALTGAWWNWYERLPDPAILDRPDGSGCAVGQRGDIWFLAGTSDSRPSRRSCRVPFGKTLLFPLVNMLSNDRPRAPSTCAELRATTTAVASSARDLFVKLDGKAVEDPAAHRVATPTCFTLESTGARASSDGYWIVIRPLSKGRHELIFGGRFDYGSSSIGRTRQDNLYDLDVQ